MAAHGRLSVLSRAALCDIPCRLGVLANENHVENLQAIHCLGNVISTGSQPFALRLVDLGVLDANLRQCAHKPNFLQQIRSSKCGSQLSDVFGASTGRDGVNLRSTPRGDLQVCRGSLRDLLEDEGLLSSSYVPGQYRLHCPQCQGGSTREKSLALRINDDGASATWVCHRAKCSWTGFLREDFYPDSTFPAYEPKQRAVLAYAAPAGNGAATPALPPGRDGAGPSTLPGGPHRTPPTKARPGGAQAGRDARRTGGGGAGRPPKLDALKFEELDEEMQEFFSVRGISRETWARNKIAQERAYSPHEGAQVKAMVFPYLRNGEIVNCKYRAPGKQFWQIKGAEKVLYGLDDIKGQQTIYIVEGEMDKLAVEEVGIRNCVSVPDGAPPKLKADLQEEPPDPTTDRKYEYLWNCREYLDKATKIVIATDADEPGQALGEELARRLGRERCWRVRWPPKDEAEPCKDANEVLLLRGPEALRECLLSAEPIPIRGLFRFRDYFDEIDLYYGNALREEQGVSTGWRSLDETYRVVLGELTVVTGVPNSGKSEWIDALLCNVCQSQGWNFALCSMENKVKDHARKLMEKYIGKPFFSAAYARSMPRMSPRDLTDGKRWLDTHFHLIRCEDDELPSIEWVLSLARAAVLRFGIRGLVIDPYNELDHQRPSFMTETEYVSQMLTKVKRFAQHHDCHVWFVAHPKQLQQWRGEPPGLYDISGSAHFVNKCDNGVVVHRNRDPDQGPLDHVQVLVRKVRNKAAGTIGETTLRYDRVSGRYFDLDEADVLIVGGVKEG